VRTGRVEGEWVEILDGLAVGDDVIFDGHFALQDGAGVVIDGSPDAASEKPAVDAVAAE
jgi:multidrug efflux pump subunit AcrA (membrane-fusion protein)